MREQVVVPARIVVAVVVERVRAVGRSLVGLERRVGVRHARSSGPKPSGSSSSSVTVTIEPS